MPKVHRNIARSTPLARLRERVTLELALVPDLDEGVLSRRIRRDIDERGAMVRVGDDFVFVVAVLVVPVEGQVVAGLYFDGVVGLDVAHDVAAHVDGVEVFDGRVVVAAFAILAVVGGDADAFEGSLVYAVDEDALGVLV